MLDLQHYSLVSTGQTSDTEPRRKEKQMNVMHWLGQQLAMLIGACYAVATEQAINSLPYAALDAA
jgi:hypothetical protein